VELAVEPPPDHRQASSDPSAVPASVSPNSVSDQPTHLDTLGFKPYVEAIAVFLTHVETRPPLTLSIEGAWGSGKSSFMLQLEDRIKAKGGKTVWFNAWRHDKEEELWAAFALDFTSKLAATVPGWKRWLLHLKLSSLRFDWRRGWFQVAKFVVLSILFLYVTIAVANFVAAANSPFRQFFSPAALATADKSEVKPAKLEEVLLTSLLKVGGLAGYLLLGFALIRKIAEVIGNPLRIELTRYMQDPKYEARAAFVETFHSDFDRLVKTYAEGCRVYVFVDDLDRCEVPKAAELMQALNLLISDSAPVFYILGLDREKIAAGLAAKYEKLLPYLSADAGTNTSAAAAGTEFGYNYLEKFIQLPFLVPQAAEKDLDKLLDSLGRKGETAALTSEPAPPVDAGLLVSLSSDSPSVRDIVKMVAPAFNYNPRRLKQFLNLFRLRALLASQTGLFGPARDDRFSPLTLEKLGKLVAIILRWPLLLADVEERPDLLVQLQSYAWGGTSLPSPGESTPQDPLLQFWLAKRNLMEMIAFPCKYGEAPPEEDHIRLSFGLDSVDIERFLQVSPPVRGREDFEGTEAPAQPDKAGLNASVKDIHSPSPNERPTIFEHSNPVVTSAEFEQPPSTESVQSQEYGASSSSYQPTGRKRPPARKMKK
jgi:hypothetical protein